MLRNLKEFKLPLPIKGLNNTDDQLNLPANMLVDVLNMDFQAVGGTKTRDGYEAYSTSGLPADKAISGGYVYKKKDGTKKQIIVSDTDVYVEGATGVFSSIKSGLSVGYKQNFETLADLMVQFDGVNTPLKYDGTTMLNLGITAPTVAPSVAVGAGAGAVTGESLGTGDGVTIGFSGTLASPPVSANTLTIHYTVGASDYTATDDGNGTITGTNVSGTINSSTGAWTLTFTTAPDDTTAITADYGAGPSGDYQYKVTFVSDSGAETNPGPASTEITLDNEACDLTNIQTGTADVVSRKIYRNAAGGTLFYYLDTISDNTTTTYADSIPDVQLGTTLAPSDHDSPPVGDFPTVYKEFLFISKVSSYPTRVYFCHQSYPEIFNTAEGTGNYLRIGLNDGQAVIGLKVLRDIMYVFKERSTWPITGDTPDDLMTLSQPISHSIGLHHRSVAIVYFQGKEVLVGLSDNHGLFIFDGYAYGNIGVQPESGINIQSFLNGLDKEKLSEAFGFNDIAKHQYKLHVRQSGAGYNDRVIVWDYQLNTITIHDIKANVVLEWNNNILFGSSQADGKVHKVGGLNDDGTAISIIAEFPWWNLGNFDTILKFLNINTTLQGEYSPQVDIYVNGDSIATTLNLYTEDVVISSVNTTFTATTVIDASAWDLSEVVLGMFAVASGGSVGTITVIDDANDTLTVASWNGGTPADGETVTVRGESWGSTAWVQEGGNYRSKKTLDIIGSDAVNLRGYSFKQKLTHSGLNNPVTLNGESLFYQPTRKVIREGV